MTTFLAVFCSNCPEELPLNRQRADDKPVFCSRGCGVEWMLKNLACVEIDGDDIWATAEDGEVHMKLSQSELDHWIKTGAVYDANGLYLPASEEDRILTAFFQRISPEVYEHLSWLILGMSLAGAKTQSMINLIHVHFGNEFPDIVIEHIEAVMTLQDGLE